MDTKTLMEWSARYHTPNYGRTPIVLVRGEGTRVWDSDGREYLDFTTGIAVTSLGHCHPVITGAIREAAATLLHVSNIFHTAPQVHLAKLLVEHSFADRVFFCNSGAEANEAALKIARKYGKERLATDRYEVIATHNAFHGRTLATLTATGQPKYQHGFEPLMPGFKHVPDNDYLPGLRKLCDESGALLIFDEIQTGVGRTGRLWGYEHSGVEPDIMTLAKALANGIPIGAMLCREEVATALTAGSHGSTFAGSAFVTSVALATLTTIIGDKLPERAEQRGRELMDGVRELQKTLPVITEVRGRGLLIGIELTRPAGPVMDACREAGLLVLTAGEKVVRLVPPLIVESVDCRRALEILGTALGQTPK